MDPPPPEIRVLQALMRQFEHLKTTRAQQSVYAQSSEAAIVRSSVEEIIATLDEQISEVEQKISQHFDDHPDLKRRRNLFTSIPGIGDTTAGSILSELPHLDRFPVCKGCGRVCRPIASGATFWNIRSRASAALQDRQRRVRKALYMPAIVVLRFNPTLSILAERLLAAGKHKWLVIGAVMRKLLVLAYGVLRSGIALMRIMLDA